MKLVVTTVVHGAARGQSHGGVYLVDLDKKAVYQSLDWQNDDIDWFGAIGGRGLRGVAFDGDDIYVAAGNAILFCDRQFTVKESLTCPYLSNAHGLSIHERKLFVASGGNDCIIALDLDTRCFDWAMWAKRDHYKYQGVTFDPTDAKGPLCINKVNLRQVQAGGGGLRMAGLDTNGLLHFNGRDITMSVELPEGARDACRFRRGVLFNDPRAGVLRYVGDNDGREDRAMAVPFHATADHEPQDSDEVRMLKRGYASGLCVLSDTVVAGGCNPAAVSLYDLQRNLKLLTVSLSREPNVAIHTIAVWPHQDSPARESR